MDGYKFCKQVRGYYDIPMKEFETSIHARNYSGKTLGLSNLESENHNLNLKKYQINKQIESILLMLEPQWSAKNITLDVFLEESIVCGDEELLSQVFINLLYNAIKFTPQNCNIRVKLSITV